MATETRLNLRFKDDETVNALTSLAKKNNVSLNQLSCDILNKYVKCADNYILDAVPMIVKSMVREELQRISISADEIIKDIYINIIKDRTIHDALATFLLPELKEMEFDKLKTDELSRLLTAIDPEK